MDDRQGRTLMQIHEDKQVQHTTLVGLQRTACYRKTGHPMVRGGIKDGRKQR